MKMTTEQWTDFCKTASWNISGELGDCETTDGEDGDNYDDATPDKTGAYAWNLAKTTAPDGSEITACYTEHATWSGTASARYDDVIETTDDFGGSTWEIYGVTLVDDDGAEYRYSKTDLHEIAAANIAKIDNIDYDSILPAITTEDIDMSNDTDAAKTITIERSNAQDIRFVGELIAESSSSDNNAHPSYSGSAGRWTELKLYRTTSEKYVCQSIGRTCWQGEHDRYSAAVCETHAEIHAFFGDGWLAKELYKHGGIDTAVVVE